MCSDILNFSDEEKINNFDRMADVFYMKNFGTLGKADFELLMFDFCMNNLIKRNEADDIVDYAKCSDYLLSNSLGITQQRVRNLKIKKQLKYPVSNFDWKKSFEKLLKEARYEGKIGRIIINIPDPNLFIELENFIEEKGGFVDIQLNRKVLQIRPEFYFALALMYEPEESKKRVVKEMVGYLTTHQKKNHTKLLEPTNFRDITKDAFTIGAGMVTVLSPLMSTIGPLLHSASNFLG